MSIEIIDKLKAKNNGDFKLLDAKDVEITPNEKIVNPETGECAANVQDALDYLSNGVNNLTGEINASQVKYEKTITESDGSGSTTERTLTNVEESLNYLYDVVNKPCKLEYISGEDDNTIHYYDENEKTSISFIFSSSAVGTGSITITRSDGYTRNFYHTLGQITYNIGEITGQHDYTYTVSAVDSMGRPSETTLTFRHIIGGIKFTTGLDDSIGNGSFIYDANTSYTSFEIPSVNITYPMSEDEYTRELSYELLTENGDPVYRYNNTVTPVQGSTVITENNQKVDIGRVYFLSSGNYKLKLTASVVSNDVVLASKEIEYIFPVMSSNTVSVISVTSIPDDANTSNNISISLRALTNNTAFQGANMIKLFCTLYRVDDSDDIIINEYELTASHGVITTLNVGKLTTAGTYKYSVTPALNGGSADNVISITKKEFNIKSDGVSDSYITDGLRANFICDGMSNDMSSDKSKWRSTTGGFYFKLNNLGFVSTNDGVGISGWISDETNYDSTVLKFTGDSYGELCNESDESYNPMNILGETNNTGLTIEMRYKTKCIGEMNARVMSCIPSSEATECGCEITYNSLTLSSDNERITTSSLENEWIHVVFVIDKEIRGKSSTSNIEDLNPGNTMRIYVNGCLVKCVEFTNSTTFSPDTNQRFLLNTYEDSSFKLLSFGESSISHIRIYDRPLKSSEVLQNYKFSIPSKEKQVEIENKNDITKTHIPTIYFINKTPTTYTFSQLQGITSKTESKTAKVNCWMLYIYYDGNEKKYKIYEDVDVYLQGTSSLAYPVKNYKIKIYKTENGKRVKDYIIPPNKSASDGWYTPEYVYTLKCDYMEQSHRNNTPTAVLYENVVSTVINSLGGNDSVKQSRLSPPKRVIKNIEYIDSTGSEQVLENVTPYRDAINGFACIVSYNDNNGDTTISELSESNAPSIENDANNIYVGSFMFNIDKSGESLGFNVTPSELSDDTVFTVTGDISSKTITLDTYPCISWEGGANDEVSAATFVTVDEYNRNKYELFLASKNYTEDEYPYDQWAAEKQNGDETTGKYNALTWYEYMDATLSPRYSYTDDLSSEDFSEDKINSLKYDKIKNAIIWVSAIYTKKRPGSDDNGNVIITTEDITDDEAKGLFRNDFENYFSLAYCITYYLQMMTLAQVDNAGKNAMFDTWGDIIYPRPYDMDTQMGETNTGDDVVSPYVEINPELSPRTITTENDTVGALSNICNDDDKHDRYNNNSYNTKNSRLWILFGKYFYDEIRSAYSTLRDSGVYDVNNISTLVNSMTSDIIGESFYNKDAVAKYLSLEKDRSDHMAKIQGNRYCRYKSFLNDRLTFIDTFFNYSGYYNKNITIRSDLYNGSPVIGYLGISVYTSQYVSIEVGQGTNTKITAFIDKDATYNINGHSGNGVLFAFTLDAKNKDLIISGAGNIRAVNEMAGLVIGNITIGNAYKITNISVANSSSITDLNVSGCSYLRVLDTSNCPNLKSNIDLTGSPYIKNVNLSNSSVTGITLLEGSTLQSLNISGCSKISKLELKSLYFLTDIIVSSENTPTNLSTYYIENCNNISSINASATNMPYLRKLTLSQCNNLQTLDMSYARAITELSITSCDNLETINLQEVSGSFLKELNFTTLKNLKVLNISHASIPGSTDIDNEDEDNTLDDLKDEAYYITLLLPSHVEELPLKELNAEQSYLRTISYGSIPTYGTCNFSKLTNLNTINIQGCENISNITDLEYKGNVTNLFYRCKRLTSLSNCKITSSGTSGVGVFKACNALSNICDTAHNNTFNFSSITDGRDLFYYAIQMDYNSIKTIIGTMSSVQDLTNAFYYAGKNNTNGYTLDSELFSNCTNLTTCTSIFRLSNVNSVPAGLFPSSVTNLQSAFMDCTKLTNVDENVFIKCTKTTTYTLCFKGCINLTTLFTTKYNIFPNDNAITLTNNAITSINRMFDSCSSLNFDIADGSINDMFTNLVNLKQAYLVFYGTKLSSINDGIFENNTHLTDISGIFMNTQLTSLPEKLFGSNQHTEKLYAGGIFSGCSNLTGTIPNTLFSNANIISLGSGVKKSTLAGNIYYGGAFFNTKISNYKKGFIPSTVTDISLLFAHGTITSSNKNGVITGIYTPSTDSTSFKGNYEDNTIDIETFSSLNNLTYAQFAFAGNTSITSVSINNSTEVINSDTPSNIMFSNTLTNMSGLFANCTSLEKPSNIYEYLFKNLPNLQDISYCFANCSSLGAGLTTIPDTIFDGSNKISSTKGLFMGCTNLANGSNSDTNSVIPASLFNNIKSTIKDVSFMFANSGISGTIGVGNYGTSNSYDYSEGKGLLSNCENLMSCSGLFSNCQNILGSIPFDMFYVPNNDNYYKNLTDISGMFNLCTGISTGNYDSIQYLENSDTEGNDTYLVPGDWLNSCKNLSNVSYLFNYVTNNTKIEQETVLELIETMFSNISTITNASYAFAHTKYLKGRLTSNFMSSSVSNTAASRKKNFKFIFSYSGITLSGTDGVESTSIFYNQNENAITNITTLEGAFYSISNILQESGYGPAIYNGKKFKTDITATGMLYNNDSNKSKLINYNDYKSVSSTKQIFSEISNYTDDSDKSKFTNPAITYTIA